MEWEVQWIIFESSLPLPGKKKHRCPREFFTAKLYSIYIANMEPKVI